MIPFEIVPIAHTVQTCDLTEPEGHGAGGGGIKWQVKKKRQEFIID